MRNERPLVSIIIPAYNKPDYTRKTLQSIVEQEYRPIELIFSDDCSPTSLEPLVEEFKCFENDLFSIRFYRQKSNLGVMGNTTFVFEQGTGKYMVPMAHDDWLIDKRFLVEAVEIMETNARCYICVGNAEIEKTNGRKMIKLPNSIDAKDKWVIIGGDVFCNMWGLQGWSGSMGWSTAIVLNLPVARSLGAFHYPFMVGETLAKKLAILPDDGFSYLFVLSSIGSVAITEKVVSVHGMPEDSYGKSEGWSKVANETMFVIFYNIYQAKLDGQYAQSIKKRSKKFVLQASVKRINPKIIRYYNYKPEVIFLMLLSYMSRSKLYKLLRYYFLTLRRIIFRDEQSLGFKEIFSKVRDRGLFRCLFPFR